MGMTHVTATVVKIDRRKPPSIADALHIQLRIETELARVLPEILAELELEKAA